MGLEKDELAVLWQMLVLMMLRYCVFACVAVRTLDGVGRLQDGRRKGQAWTYEAILEAPVESYPCVVSEFVMIGLRSFRRFFPLLLLVPVGLVGVVEPLALAVPEACLILLEARFLMLVPFMVPSSSTRGGDGEEAPKV